MLEGMLSGLVALVVPLTVAAPPNYSAAIHQYLDVLNRLGDTPDAAEKRRDWIDDAWSGPGSSANAAV